jgi:hypothetical protein
MNNIEKEFVEYTEALELKQLGFDETCLSYYEGESFSCHLAPIKGDDYIIPAPLFQQAFRWFREKYGLYGIPEERTLNNFSYQIKSNKEGAITFIVYGGYPLNFNSYKEAELACLRKLIEIIKNK